MMWFKLAALLGMSVRQCQQEVDSAEFSEWCAYLHINPTLEDRIDMHAGRLAYLYASSLTKQRLNPKPYFITWYEKPQTEQEKADILKRHFLHQNAYAANVAEKQDRKKR